jgi:hypothetical protein
MTIRTNIINKNCNCDPNYIIGLVDWDFSLTMRKNKYNLAMLCHPEYKIKNETKYNTKGYLNNRYKKEVIQNSKELFNKKWKIIV